MLIYLTLIDNEADRSKFEILYEKYKSYMYVIANKILDNDEDSHDAVHQAFLSIAENMHKVGDVDSPLTRGYVAVIVNSKAIDIYRYRKNCIQGELIENLNGIEIPMPGDHGIADAIASLPAAHRDLILLRFDVGLSIEEIAKHYGKSYAAVQKMLWRAKAALREELKKYGYDVKK